MPITPLPPADYEPEYSAANYSQTMGQYNHPGTFRFWCQKVLPLVYDDSLSYYELLCKVVDYLNKTMEDVNTAAQDVDDLNNSFNSLQQYTNATFDEFKSVYDELQTYVNSYFSGLDVQEEIDNKLDEMTADGTFDTLLAPYMVHYQDELNLMKARLTALETNYTPGGTTADAELADIRVGYDGKIWSSAGNAVRGQIGDIEDDITPIIGTGRNLFDPQQLVDIAGWTAGTNDYFGTGTALNTAFSNGFEFKHSDFEPNTQYIISFECYHEGESAEGNMGNFVIHYTDGTTQNVTYLTNSITSWTARTAVSNANKTIDAIKFHITSLGSNVWHLRNITVTKKNNYEISGSVLYPYEPFYLTALDKTERTITNRNYKKLYVDLKLGDFAPDTWSPTASTQRVTLKDDNGINLYAGDIIRLSDYTNARIYICYKQGETVRKPGWKTSEFICQFDALYNFVIANTTDAEQGSVSDLGDLLEIYHQYSIADLFTSYDAESKIEYDPVKLNGSDFESGSITLATGSNETGSTRIRSKEPFFIPKGSIITAENCRYSVSYFTDEMEYDSSKSGGWKANPIVIENNAFIRIIIRKISNEAISDSEIDSLVSGITLYINHSYSNIKKYRDFIPKYLTSYPTAKENALKDIAAAGYDGFAFAFITDLHWEKNAKISPVILKELCQDLNLCYVFNGGDLIDGDVSRDNALSKLNDCYTKYLFENTGTFYIVGNHDSNTIGQTSYPERFLSNKNIFGVCMRNLYNQKVTLSDFSTLQRMPYYIDAPMYKTRIIIADTHLEGTGLYQTQLDWLQSALESTPNNYKIIMMAHILYELGDDTFGLQPAAQGTQIIDLCDDFNTQSTGAKVVLIIGGHVHRDANYVTDSGINVILVTRDAMQRVDGNGEIYTNSATAFDIVTINYTDKTINCRRIGRGADRSFTYV